jgi:hypothetical protein
MTVRLSLSALAAFTLLATVPVQAQVPGGGGGGGGGGQQQRPPENLLVLRKDMPRDSVVMVMRGFTAALGVRCEYCHTEREGGVPAGAPGAPGAPGGAAPAGGPPGGGAPGGGFGGGGGAPPLNYALDNKDTKKTARVMLKMVDSINKVFLAVVPTRDNMSPINVTCVTCHRGVARPMTIDAVLATTIEKSGVDSAISRYRALRTDVAAGRYNFTEQPVTLAALRLAAAAKYDDAMKLLQMNQEFNPTSATIEYEIADVLINKGDKDAGIARLKAILVKNPNDRRARGRLTQLGVQP